MAGESKNIIFKVAEKNITDILTFQLVPRIPIGNAFRKGLSVVTPSPFGHAGMVERIGFCQMNKDVIIWRLAIAFWWDGNCRTKTAIMELPFLVEHTALAYLQDQHLPKSRISQSILTGFIQVSPSQLKSWKNLAEILTNFASVQSMFLNQTGCGEGSSLLAYLSYHYQRCNWQPGHPHASLPKEQTFPFLSSPSLLASLAEC